MKNFLTDKVDFKAATAVQLEIFLNSCNLIWLHSTNKKFLLRKFFADSNAFPSSQTWNKFQSQQENYFCNSFY